MVIEDEPANLGLDADLDRLVGRRVTVVREARVLLGQEVRVVDDGVHALETAHEGSAHRHEADLVVVGERLGPLQEVLLVDHLIERRRVRDVGPRHAIAIEAISHGAERVIERDRRDVESTEVELDPRLDLMKVERGGHRLERHRKELVAGDATDHRVQLVRGGEQRVHRDPRARNVRRREER